MRIDIALVGLVLGLGCSSTDGATDSTSSDTDIDTDELDDDGDGISNGDEAELGTDPNKADTDGDGFSDSEEVAGNTSPLDDADHPHAGGWPIAACRDSVQATGNEAGKVAYDFALMDQFGEDVRLHSFCDKVVLLAGAAFW